MEQTKKRLIDTMSALEIHNQIVTYPDSLLDTLKRLCLGIPFWQQNLNEMDKETWVLCFVSDSDRTCRNKACWIVRYVSGARTYPFVCSDKMLYKYAEPVHFHFHNIKYNA